MSRTITIIDVETGGLDETTHQITEIGALNFDLRTLNVNWDYQTYLKPYCGLIYDKKVLDKTLVTEEDIMGGKDAKIVVKELTQLFKQSNTSNGKEQGNTIIAGHNINFDRKFMEALFLFNEKDIYESISTETQDTLQLARMLWVGDNDKHNLKACCERIGHQLTGAHGAMNDVRATFELYKYFIQKIRSNSNFQVVGKDAPKSTKNHRKYFEF